MPGLIAPSLSLQSVPPHESAAAPSLSLSGHETVIDFVAEEALSPLKLKFEFTALPHPVNVIEALPVTGAFTLNWKLTVPETAFFRPVCVISFETSWVPSPAMTAMIPDDAFTFRPPASWLPIVGKESVYVPSAPFESDAGPVMVTVGAEPPEWQLLQPLPARLPDVMPPLDAKARFENDETNRARASW